MVTLVTPERRDWVSRHERDIKSLIQWAAGALLALGATSLSVETFVIVATCFVGIVVLALSIRKVRRDTEKRLAAEDVEWNALQKIVYHTWIEPTEEIIERIDAECAPTEPTVVVPLWRIDQMLEVIEDHTRLQEENKAFGEAIGHLKATIRRKDEEVRDLKNAVYMQGGLGSENCFYCDVSIR